MSVTYEIGHSDGAITWGDIGGTCDHLGRWCDHLDGAITWSNGAIVWVVTIIIFSQSLAKVQLVFVSFYNYNIFKKVQRKCFFVLVFSNSSVKVCFRFPFSNYNIFKS